MAVSVVAGARLLADDEDVVVVLRASRDLSVGTPLDAPDAFEQVKVARAVVGERYLAPPTTVDAGTAAVLALPVRAGELVPVVAVRAEAPVDVRTVTVPVDPLHAPPALQPGDRVDVWSSPGASEAGPPRLVLAQAVVHAVPDGEVGLGGEVGVVLAVPADDVGAVVAATRAGQVDLVAVPIDAQLGS